jgi:hypothetical protein
MEKVCVGIDSHKETNLLARAFEGRDKPENIGRVSADLNRTVDAIRAFMKKHGLDHDDLHARAEPAGLSSGSPLDLL